MDRTKTSSCKQYCSFREGPEEVKMGRWRNFSVASSYLSGASACITWGRQ